MTKPSLFIIATTVCALAGPIQAKAGETSLSLTWRDVVSIAKERNPNLITAKKQAEAEVARYRESFNGVLPSLTLNNAYFDSENNSSSAERWQASARASWELFNLSQIAGISAARAVRNRAQASLNSTMANVRLSLFQAFAGLLYQQESISVSSTILSIRSNNARMVSLRYDSGRESKGNRMESDAELLEAQAGLAQAKRDLRAAQQEMNHQLGEERYQTVQATGALNAAIPADPDFETLVDSHPLVAISRADVDAARAAVKEARGQIFPTFTANYTRSFTDHTEFPGNPSWTASGVLSLPIFGNGPTSTFYAIRASIDDRTAAEAALGETRAQVRSNLESAWANLQRAVDQVKVEEAFLRATRQRNAESDIRYSSGLMSYEDWARIVTDRVNLERSTIQAHRDAAVSEATWRQAQGLGLEDL